MTNQTSTETVQQIMTSNPQTVDFNASISDALKLLTNEKFNSVPVVNGNQQCVGILSRADLSEVLLAEDCQLATLIEAGAFSQLSASILETCSDKQVREVMTHDVVTVTSGCSIRDACELMAQNQIHHLPVVNSENVVSGIVSTFDVIGWFANR